MSQYIRQVILYKDEDGYWIVECPFQKQYPHLAQFQEQQIETIQAS
ncbi:MULTISPECIES: hypothetical protein [unclassified Nodularia (in: cyanobacteria)]|nr:MULTISPECIES: hypothetical protein [unclassified Nodularia (in: cyanobacteria)]MBE9201423.1 hypothetical protein [Nodularia sp. LEGE 06071]MCC2691493.1 hypothetical protein [Nodularia sp. LEGE 04288]